MNPPYIKNMGQATNIMYPVLKGNAAFGGEISKKSIKHLLLEFNCLGIKGTQDVTLVLTAKSHRPLEINFRKKCSTSKIILL